jgi:4-amino-4-deoxy-L-arabinose transferase-like glycosyltransferase
VPLALIVLVVCLFSGLGALGLVGPDEPRYAAIARAMAETHDWITPRLWGAPWFEKPVLYYWAAGIAMRIFGVSEFAARLPSAFAALLALSAIKWTAIRSYGIGTGWYAILLLPTSAAMIGFSRAAGPDMLFAGLITAAMAVASEMLQKPRPGPVLRIAFGFFLGAAVLAKGPAAVILAGGAVLLWGALSGEWRAPFRFLHPLVIAVFCGTALPWYVLCALRNPDFLDVFIWQHNFQRYLTPVFEHRQPFWFYVPVILVAAMPWIALFIPAFYGKQNREPWQSSPGLFILCWAIFPFLFFSFSQSKLPGYILPSIPPLFLLISRAVDRLFLSDRNISAGLVGITGAMFPVFAASLEVIFVRVGHSFDVPSSRVISLLVLAGIGGLIAVVFSLRKRPADGLTAIVLLIVAILGFMNIGILPFADSRISARASALEGFRLNPSSQDVAVSELKRDWHYGLNYYFGRDLPEWAPGTPLPEWLFTNEKNAIELRRFGDRIHEVSRVGAPFVVLIHVSPENPSPR